MFTAKFYSNVNPIFTYIYHTSNLRKPFMLLTGMFYDAYISVAVFVKEYRYYGTGIVLIIIGLPWGCPIPCYANGWEIHYILIR